MGRIEGKSKNRFKTAVEKCDEIKNSFKAGLSALGKDSLLIKVKDTNLIDGSVDIDSAVKGKRPSDTRWDYAVGYSGEAYFIEVHSADTKNVDEMVKKVTWLKNWLVTNATDLNKLHKNGIYHWIPSGRVKILKNSTQYKKIAANKLVIANPLILK